MFRQMGISLYRLHQLLRENTTLLTRIVLGWGIFTAILMVFLFAFVDLKPRVDQNFFFSSEDPQFRADKIISDIFPQPPQFVIAAKGNIHTQEYTDKVKKFSDELNALEEVFSVQSLTHGPDSLKDATESPLWKRVLISGDDSATFISAFIKDVDIEQIVAKIEAIVKSYHERGFELMVSGAPYIMELIRKYLLRDLKIFTGVAFLVFGVMLFLIFRSMRILLGTLITCVNASALTLMSARLLGISIGPLTANLSTIVFVLTLSQIVFLTFNWQGLSKNDLKDVANGTRKAIRLTLHASFWSMLTTLLGFVSLLFVQAEPLRQFGLSGSMGTLIAFCAAYGIYPWFLSWHEEIHPVEEVISSKTGGMSIFSSRMQSLVTLALAFVTILMAVGLSNVNTDPNLFSYFQKGSELRNGLEYIDANGGSSPLKLIVMDKDRKKFNTGDAYYNMWVLHKALEAHPMVGSVVSLPIILAEAKRSPLTIFLTNEWLLQLLESPIFGEIASYFVTPDRDKAFYLLRMKEMDRETSRLEIVDQIKKITEENNFAPVLVGGVYLLQGKLSQLLTSSLISGLALLIIMFVIMGWILSHSLKVPFAMLISLAILPVCMLGLTGHFKIPLDVISAPAANLAVAMGVDSMIHMLVLVRRLQKQGGQEIQTWTETTRRLWKPIFSSAFIICAGFGLFGISSFPPTQRFGISVVVGTLLAPLVTLFVLPRFCTLSLSMPKLAGRGTIKRHG